MEKNTHRRCVTSLPTPDTPDILTLLVLPKGAFYSSLNAEWKWIKELNYLSLVCLKWLHLYADVLLFSYSYLFFLLFFIHFWGMNWQVRAKEWIFAHWSFGWWVEGCPQAFFFFTELISVVSCLTLHYNTNRSWAGPPNKKIDDVFSGTHTGCGWEQRGSANTVPPLRSE